MERNVKLSWQELVAILRDSKHLAPRETIKNITLVHPKELLIRATHFDPIPHEKNESNNGGN